MNLTIELSDEKAGAERLVEPWVEQIAEQHVEAQPAPIAHLQETNPKEWARLFHEWAESLER